MDNEKFKPFHPPHIYLDNQAYFITASIWDNRHILRSTEARKLIRDELRERIVDLQIKLYAWVILTNHYHLLFHVQEAAQMIQLLKGLHGKTAIDLNKLQSQPGRKVWRNYWDRCPRDEHELYTYFNYIHFNSIKHGLVRFPDNNYDLINENIQVHRTSLPDLHDALASYEFSSYSFYLKKWGREGMNNMWFDYPLRVHVDGDL
ncbi:MAG: hypothetical protein MAG451_00530 [Anaerolineales bacterium]|nr:hypothetical protein [Anaerolineales bacterium]